MAQISITCDGEAIVNFAMELQRYANEKMSKNPALVSMAVDLLEICAPNYDVKVWNNLHKDYKQAWLGEIKRRLGLIKASIKDSEHEKPLNKMARSVLSDTSLVPTTIDAVSFSQFAINDHFQGQYEGQPGWLSDKHIVAVAPTLRGDPMKSFDMRISVYLHGGKWVVLNNRGFALHCLASVMPRRFAPNPTLKSEEAKRFTTTRDSKGLNYANSVPDRGKPSTWESTIPTTIIGVASGKQGTDVICTIKSDWNNDVGNEKVYNALSHSSEVVTSPKDPYEKKEH